MTLKHSGKFLVVRAVKIAINIATRRMRIGVPTVVPVSGHVERRVAIQGEIFLPEGCGAGIAATSNTGKIQVQPLAREIVDKIGRAGHFAPILYDSPDHRSGPLRITFRPSGRNITEGKAPIAQDNRD